MKLYYLACFKGVLTLLTKSTDKYKYNYKNKYARECIYSPNSVQLVRCYEAPL